jgi:hypothetical protein
MTNYSGRIVTRTSAVRGHIGNLVINLFSSLTIDLIDVTDDNNFYCILTTNVQILTVEPSINGNICLCKTLLINPQTLAARWMIFPEHARLTVVMTIQRGLRTRINPTLSWMFSKQ